MRGQLVPTVQLGTRTTFSTMATKPAHSTEAGLSGLSITKVAELMVTTDPTPVTEVLIKRARWTLTRRLQATSEHCVYLVNKAFVF